MAPLKKIFGALNPIGHKRRRDIESLRRWVEHVTEDVEKNFTTLTNANGTFKASGWGIDIDGSNFTKKELAPVAQAFEKLHDACFAKDVSLSIAGFDLLPHQYAVTTGSAASHYGAQISVNANMTYCLFDHPRCRELEAAGHKADFSKRRTAAPAPVAPPALIEAPQPLGDAVGQKMNEGLAEGIAVRKPLILKPTGPQ
jgi:hypothetical protein